MASTTSTRRRKATAPVEEPTNVLSAFDEQLVEDSQLLGRYETGAVFARVIFGGTLAAMYDAADEDTPALKSDASKSAVRERRDGIRNRILRHVGDITGRHYSWQGVSEWIDAARINAVLPEDLQCKRDENGDATGVFHTWALRALGRIEDETVRDTLAEKLAAAGNVSQSQVEDAVREALNEDKPKPVQPKSAADMTADVVAKVEKRAAKVLGSVQTIAGQMADEDHALELADFGRLVWIATPADPAEEDKEKRNRKRIQVFRAAVEQLLFSDDEALSLADGDEVEGEVL